MEKESILSKEEALEQVIRIGQTLHNKSDLEEINITEAGRVYFDPNLHRVSLETSKGSYCDGTILRTLNPGYIHKRTGEVLKKAGVQVLRRF